MKDIKLAYPQCGFLKGAYSRHKSLEYLQDKLKNEDVNLKSYELLEVFSKSMTKNFTKNDDYKDVKILELANHQLGHRRAICGPDNSSLSESNFGLNNNPPFQKDVDAIMAQTKCFVC